MNDASLEEPLPAPPWKHYGGDLIRRIFPIVAHGIAMLTAIAFMAATKSFLDMTFGPDALFFDVLPVRYSTHAIDLITFVRFGWNVWRDMR